MIEMIENEGNKRLTINNQIKNKFIPVQCPPVLLVREKSRPVSPAFLQLHAHRQSPPLCLIDDNEFLDLRETRNLAAVDHWTLCALCSVIIRPQNNFFSLTSLAESQGN